MEALGSQIVNGLTIGAEYALIAAGLALIFGVLGIVNFAHGEFYMIGAYLMFFIQDRGELPYGVAAVLALVAMAVFGALFYFIVVHRILNLTWQIQLIATLATSIILVNFMIVVGSSLPQQIYSPLSGITLALGETRFSAQRVLILAAALIAFAALYLFLTYTKPGKAVRAMSQNREAAAVVGIPLHRVGLATVIVGSMLAGVASITIAPLYNVQPPMGQLVVIKAFAAVVMGGFGNVTGAIIAGFTLGLIEAMSVGYISSEYADAIVLGFMVLVLLVRPHGLFGKAVRT